MNFRESTADADILAAASFTPFQVIDRDLCRIRDAQGTNAKIEELRTISHYTRNVITWSFDPFHQFGISHLKHSLLNILGTVTPVTDDDILSALERSDFRWIRNNCEDFNEIQFKVTDQILRRFQGYQLKIGGTSFRKVFPNAYKTFSLQLAGSYEPAKVEYPCYAQPKYDGVRCVVIVNSEGMTETLSRNGKPLYNIHPEILEELSKFPGTIFDGEAITDGGDFNLSVGVIHRKNSDDIMSNLILFDAITLEEFKARKCTRLYQERYQFLKDNITHTPIAEHHLVFTRTDAEAKYDEFRAQGHEGAILKRQNGKYTFKRTLDWMKLKPLLEDSFKIVGYKEGRGRLKGMLGALIIETQKGTKTDVGGGFSDKQRTHFWEIKDELVGEHLDAEFMEYTPAGKLRHPRFIKIRFDKEEM